MFSVGVTGFDDNALEDVKKKVGEGLDMLPDSVKNVLPAGLDVDQVPSVEEGEDMLKERCFKYGTNESFDNAMVSVPMYCFTRHFQALFKRCLY